MEKEVKIKIKGIKGEDGYTPVKGKDYFDGKDGTTPTKEEIKKIITPLIPKVKDGKDYVLKSTDKKEIASLIKVPIVEKIIEKTEVIKEVAVKDTPKEVKAKLLKEGLDYSEVQNTPDIPALVQKINIEIPNIVRSITKDISSQDVYWSDLKGEAPEFRGSGGVSKIIAGTNVTISPVDGLGDVTINSSGGGSTAPLTLTADPVSDSLIMDLRVISTTYSLVYATEVNLRMSYSSDGEATAAVNNTALWWIVYYNGTAWVVERWESSVYISTITATAGIENYPWLATWAGVTFPVHGEVATVGELGQFASVNGIILFQCNSTIPYSWLGVGETGGVTKSEADTYYEPIGIDLRLDQTSPQTMTGLSDGYLKLTSGVIGIGTPSADTFETFSKNLKAYEGPITEVSDTVTTITYTTSGGDIIKTITEVSDTVTTLVFSGVGYPAGLPTTKTLTTVGDTIYPTYT